MADSWRVGEKGDCRVRTADAIRTFLVYRFILSIKVLKVLIDVIRFDGCIDVGTVSVYSWWPRLNFKLKQDLSVGGEGRRDSLSLFSVFRCWVVKVWMRLIRVDLRIILSVLRRFICLESCVDLS